MRTRAESAAVVSIGDELTIGQSLDTNSKWLSERLTEMGFAIVEHVTVPDDVELMAATFERLCEVCTTVIVTGGLGPTADDLTRQAIAKVMREPLVEDASSVEQIEQWFARSNRVMPALNRVQALRPATGISIPNAHGTAPGMHCRVEGTDVYCLPGPPDEMKPMFNAYVRTGFAVLSGRVVRTRVLQTIGLGESEVATRLGGLMVRDRVPLVGTTASGGVVSVRVRYEGSEAVEAVEQKMESTVAEVRRTVGDFVFDESGRTLAEVVISRLRDVRASVATVESCTGGMLGEAITAVAGSSDVYVGGWVTYGDDLKQRAVGVKRETLESHGAVSFDVASEMALGGLTRSDARYCLSITGIAGPGGGTAEKPVGTVWICLASAGGGSDCRRFLMRGDREAVRRWSVTSALAMLELHLRGRGATRLLRQTEP